MPFPNTHPALKAHQRHKCCCTSPDRSSIGEHRWACLLLRGDNKMVDADARFAGQELHMHAPAQLPAYAPMLAAYQRAHAAELRVMIADLPLRVGDHVLDMACGAGVYSVWLAEHIAPHGTVV